MIGAVEEGATSFWVFPFSICSSVGKDDNIDHDYVIGYREDEDTIVDKTPLIIIMHYVG